jgi:hypothetical protein
MLESRSDISPRRGLKPALPSFRRKPEFMVLLAKEQVGFRLSPE